MSPVAHPSCSAILSSPFSTRKVSNQIQGPEEVGGHSGVKIACLVNPVFSRQKSALTTMSQHCRGSVNIPGFPRYQVLVVIKKILYWCVSPELKSPGPSYELLKVSPTC